MEIELDSFAGRVMEIEVIPIYGYGWFEIALQRPMPVPEPFRVTAAIDDGMSIAGRIGTPGHQLENCYVALRRRYRHEATNYEVEVADRPADGSAAEPNNIICNGYAVVKVTAT